MDTSWVRATVWPWWRNSVRPFWKENRWLFFASVAVLSLVLGTIGWHEYFRMPGVGRTSETWLSSFDTNLGMFTLNQIPSDPMPTALAWARFIAPLVLVTTLVSATIVVYRSLTQRTKAGRRKGHLLIIGCGATGRSVAVESVSSGVRSVVIDLTSGQSFADELRELGVPVLPLPLEGGKSLEIGPLRRSLKSGKASTAREVLVATGDDNMNARVARTVENLSGAPVGWAPDRRDWRGRQSGDGPRAGPLVFVESSTLDLVYWLQESLPRLGIDAIEWFNVKERGARDLLDEISVTAPGIAPGLSDSQEPPLLVIVGVTETAAAVAVQYCRNWACSLMLGVDVIPRLTFVDDLRSNDATGRELMDRVLRDWGPDSTVADGSRCVIEIVTSIEAALESEDTTAVVIAVEDDIRSLGAARVVQHVVPDVPIWLCSFDVEGIATFALPSEGHAIHIRSMATYALSIGRIRTGLSEDLARAMQGADYLSRHSASTRGSSSDPADRLWAYLDEETKEKNRAAVEGWRTALDKLGLSVVRTGSAVPSYQLDWLETDFVAEYLHEAWRNVMDSKDLWKTKESPSLRTARSESAGGLDGPAGVPNPDRNPWSDLPADNRRWSIEQAMKLQEYLDSFDYSIEEKPWRRIFVAHAARRYHATFAGGTREDPKAAWDLLDASTQEANESSARAALVYLNRLGMTIVEADATRSPVAIAPDEEELLAPLEHDRWLEYKRQRGWISGDRSDQDKTHPDIRPWSDLDEGAKEKDRVRIRCIPELFAGVILDGTPVEIAHL